ncbi:hypothetical protein AC062_0023 [Pasteurellaceae bacterium NI1060]|nr:hypothetical protein AC062_0023 [Pasteurellaceae bacterium NI1060]
MKWEKFPLSSNLTAKSEKQTPRVKYIQTVNNLIPFKK